MVTDELKELFEQSEQTQYNGKQHYKNQDEILTFSKNEDYLTYLKNYEFDEILELGEEKSLQFPDGILPDWVQDKVDQTAEMIEAPKTMVAMTALSVLSVALHAKVKMTLRPSWIIRPNVFMLVVALPGESKTPTLKEMYKPVRKYEDEIKQLHELNIHSLSAQYESLDEQINKAKKELNKIDDTNGALNGVNKKGILDKISRLGKEKNDLPSLNNPRITADEVTPEGYIQLLADNKGVLSIISAEMDIFTMFSNGANGIPKPEALLKAYNQEQITKDLKGDKKEGSKGVHINSPSSVCFSMIQPIVLKNMSDLLIGRGLLDRFILAFPESRIGTKQFIDIEPDSRINNIYDGAIERMLKTKDDSYHLTFEPEAQKVFNDFLKKHDKAQAEGNELYDLGSYATKIPQNIGKLIPLLHVADTFIHGDVPEEISKETVVKAISLYDFIISNAFKGMNVSRKNLRDAAMKTALSKIKNSKKLKGHQEINIRDLVLTYDKSSAAQKEVAIALEGLKDRGYLIRFNVGRKKNIWLNPKIMD
ncbi:YfjI family protein [Mammaliicoccus vitulinus]|uniref:YfjI family protein n=1 Tax=Mammaliicoccus vitulinus TaxID=71237 RepID=UPI002DB70884|nr:YfjI family protein [Mammaliicoccus vitulinus]MEB7657621.1 YfjI family protein [Mammaliicoccus vitulinus]